MRLFRAALAAIAIAALSIGAASAQILPATPSVVSASLTTACGTSTGCATTAVSSTSISPGESVQVALSGGTGATAVIETSIDCVNYQTIATYTTAGGALQYSGVPNGKCLQVRVSAISSGTVASTIIPVFGAVQQVQNTGSGIQDMLASAVAASAAQAWTSYSLGFPKRLTLCLSASAATTFTVTESLDGSTFFGGTLADAATSANYAPAGAGTLCEMVSPAAFVKVATSAAVTVTAQLQATY